ncbi:type II toxin-antitoxin system RelE/ParE family toxin [Candidatus Woesearchaeota archaeon]|nr:type II toxin-antitoxin system RelE/ParE family toxin [Candidatus Woesearchaeota archaeon]
MKYIVEQTEGFAQWHSGLRDLRAKAAIIRRITRAEAGNLGDIKPVGGGVSEMRVDVGTGYRLYFTLRGGQIIILLAGGEKSSQQSDIKHAIALAREL